MGAICYQRHLQLLLSLLNAERLFWGTEAEKPTQSLPFLLRQPIIPTYLPATATGSVSKHKQVPRQLFVLEGCQTIVTPHWEKEKVEEMEALLPCPQAADNGYEGSVGAAEQVGAKEVPCQLCLRHCLFCTKKQNNFTPISSTKFPEPETTAVLQIPGPSRKTPIRGPRITATPPRCVPQSQARGSPHPIQGATPARNQLLKYQTGQL